MPSVVAARRCWPRSRVGGATTEGIDWSDPTEIPDVFVTSAAVVRYLRDEPLLPAELTPADWPATPLRPAYDALEQAFQRLLRSFLTAPD